VSIPARPLAILREPAEAPGRYRRRQPTRDILNSRRACGSSPGVHCVSVIGLPIEERLIRGIGPWALTAFALI